MKRKITALILYFILCYTTLSPLYSFGSTIINDITFEKNPNNSICIDLASSGKFNYFIYAQSNTLFIELKDTRLSEEIYTKINSLKQIDSNVKDVKISDINDNHYKISIELADLKKFKFVLNSKNGISSPYGFDNKTKIQTPKTNKIDKVNLNEWNSNKVSTNTIKPKIKPVIKEYKNINPDDDIITTSNYASTYSETGKTPNSSLENHISSKRLNESAVNVPANYGEKPEEVVTPIVEPTISAIEDLSKKVEPKKEEPKKIEPAYKPIPSEELIKRLQSNIDEMPRLIDVKKSVSTESSSNEEYNTEKPIAGSDNEIVESLISNIKPLPKGKAIILDSKTTPDIAPIGSKTYEVSQQDNQIKQDTIDTQLDKINLIPRDLDSLSLGLSEEYDDLTIDDVIDIPAPKPAYTSDGAIAFTVFSSKATYKGKAPIRPIQMVNDNGNFSGYNYSMIERGENDNQVSAKFKNQISDAKNFFRNGKIAQSENAYRKAIAITPQQPWGYIAIASFYESQNRYDEAIRTYNKALSMLPNKVELQYNLALNYYKNKNFSLAIENLSQVITKAPDFTLAYYNLGTLYYKMNEYQKAVEYLKTAVKLNPVLTDAQYNLALAFIKNGNKSEAINHLHQCNDTDPDDRQCTLLLNNI